MASEPPPSLHLKQNEMGETIKQPDLRYQQAVDEIMSEEPTPVKFCGNTFNVGWLHNGTVRKFSHLMLTEKDPNKRNAKICTAVLLNNVFKIFFFYWIVWRYLYYIKDLDQVEILRVLDIAKKKIQQVPFSLVIILSTGMMDTMMTMTKEEAEATQAELHGVQRTASERNTDSSSKENSE